MSTATLSSTARSSNDVIRLPLAPCLLATACVAIGVAVTQQVGLVLVAINVCLATLLLVSVRTDFRARVIPNWLTYPAIIAAWILNTSGGRLTTKEPVVLRFETFGTAMELPGIIGLQASLLGAVVCFGVMFVLYDLAGSGGGDLKLATALGAFLGVQQGVMVILWTHVLAGGVLLLWIVWQRGPLTLLTLLARSLGAIFLRGRIAPPSEQDTSLLQKPIPLAGFFAAGVVLTLLGAR